MTNYNRAFELLEKILPEVLSQTTAKHLRCKMHVEPWVRPSLASILGNYYSIFWKVFKVVMYDTNVASYKDASTSMMNDLRDIGPAGVRAAVFISALLGETVTAEIACRDS